MVTGVSLSLVVILLLLAPGVLGLQLFFKYAQRNPSPSRIQWVAWSVLVSLVSIAILYAFSGAVVPVAKTVGGAIENNLQTVLRSELEFSIAEISILYLLHLVVIGVGGGVVGLIDSEVIKSDQVLDPREPWEYAFDEIPVDGEPLDIVLDDGSIVRGNFNDTAWESSKRELFLEDPFEVVIGEDGTETDTQDLGRSILIQSDAISYIVFTNEDPNQGRMEESEIDEQDREEAEEAVEKLASTNLSDYEEGTSTDDLEGDEEEGADE
ncbi:DUF6338 family protein [Halobellus inordinatus]|uniref:DUF6338 family protein n=1 Tax=Halobellus inordinatus TaxID=1126236 RepID=UPI00210E18E8|nr:DUF6338 family protein [Halobellus inordinatus]